MTAHAQDFVWPVGGSDSLAAVERPCGDGPACYFLSSDASPDPSRVWRDSNPFQKHPLTKVSDPDAGLYHLGADLNLGAGTSDGKETVRSVAAGTIVAVLDAVPGFGKMIFIEHATVDGPILSVYGHVDWLPGGPPAKGKIGKGDPIAEVGDGDGVYRGKDHLHFEIRKGRNLVPGCGYTGRKYDADPNCKTSSVRVSEGPQGQIDPIAFMMSASARVKPYDVQFKEPFRDAWNLPSNSRLLPTETCTNKDAAALGAQLPGPTACRQILRGEDGSVFLLVKHHIRKFEEGNYSVWTVGTGSKIIGYIKARHGVVSIQRDGKIELLGVDYNNWNGRSGRPPYLEYEIAGNAVALVNGAPQVASSGSSRASPPPAPSGGGVKAYACSVAQWEGTISNVSDLFECDAARAIAALAEGRKILFAVRSVSFSNGKFRASFGQIPSSAAQAAQRMNDGKSQFSWDDWMTRTQTNNYTIRCEFPAGAGAKLTEGKTIEVYAKLQNYTGRDAAFFCE